MEDSRESRTVGQDAHAGPYLRDGQYVVVPEDAWNDALGTPEGAGGLRVRLQYTDVEYDDSGDDDDRWVHTYVMEAM